MRRPRFTFLNAKKRPWSLLVLLLPAVLFVFAPHPAHAQFTLVGNVIGNSIFLILANILIVVTKLFASLTGIFVSLLVVVARYNTFLKADVVMSGWPIVRDLMNMVFIIGLLIIAAGTVLRLQNYRYNRLLGKLIIMALLVNFSKFIAVFLLQFAQVVMLTFVNAFKDVAFANFSHMFGLDAVLNFSNEQVLKGGLTENSGANFSLVVTLLAGLAMMIVAFVVILAICVVLFVRIIALWLLIILSPLAYALRVIPNTEKYASQWWSEFGKYATVGPVLAFFLWIALALVAGEVNCATTDTKFNQDCGKNPLIAQDVQTSAAFQQANTDTETLRADFLSQALSLNRLVTFVVSIIFLIMGLNYAQKSGGAGGAFAGKVASAGFGAAATVTGLNAIRDRTIAPVQGWLKNRQIARQSAIQERTQTVEAAGDRARSALGRTRIGQAASRAPIFGEAVRRGTERSEAAAAGYERQRTARVGQERGFENRSAGNLEQRMVSSTDQRERTAALQELQKRGRLDLTQPQVLAAFHDLTNPTGVNGRTFMADADRRKVREDAVNSAAETADWTQAQTMLPVLTATEGARLLQGLNNRGRLDLSDAAQRAEFDRVTNQGLGFGGLKEAERRKFRLDTIQKNADMLNPTELRALLPALTNPQERLSVVQSLDNKKALDGNNAADQTIVNDLRVGLRDLPAELKKFDDGLRRNNPRMALETIYQGFRSGRNAVDQYLDDAHQGLISTAALTTRDHAAMVSGLQNVNGMSMRAARDHINETILNNARTKEDYNKVMDPMEWKVRSRVLSGATLDRATPDEKRDWMAMKGAIGEAYAGAVDRNGNSNTDVRTQKFIETNSSVVAEMAKKGTLTFNTVAAPTAMRTMMDSRRIGKAVLEEMVKNNPEMRDAAKQAAVTVNYETNTAVDAAGMPIASANSSTPQGQKENNRREIALMLAEGGKVTNPVNGLDESVFDVVYGSLPVTEQANARHARRNAIQKVGDALGKMDTTLMSDAALRDVVINITPTSLYKISEKQPDIAREIATRKRLAEKVPVGTTFHGENMEEPEHDMLARHVRSLSSRNDRGI